IERRRVIERERRRGLIRRAHRVLRRAREIARALPLRREELEGVVVLAGGRTLDRDREATVRRLLLRGAHVADDRLSPAMVFRLERAVARDARRSHEGPRAQRRDEVEQLAEIDRSSVRERLLANRNARDRDELEQAELTRLEARRALPQRVVEARRRGG